MMKATRYFVEQVMRKRPYIQREWCQNVIASPLRREVQADGRIKFWGEVWPEGEARSRILRVVTLDDAETLHNAFFDRGYPRDRS